MEEWGVVGWSVRDRDVLAHHLLLASLPLGRDSGWFTAGSEQMVFGSNGAGRVLACEFSCTASGTKRSWANPGTAPLCE